MPLLPDGGNYKGGGVAPSSRIPQGLTGGYLGQLANQYGANLQSQLGNNYQSYLGNVGIADAVYGQAQNAAQASYGSDLARLGEQQFRDVDLARLANQYLGDYQGNTYRNQQQGIVRNQGFLSEQFNADAANAQAVTDYLNGRKNLTTEQYNQAVHYLTQRGINLGNLQSFANREYDLTLQDASNQLNNGLMSANLQKVQGERAAGSDATVRGAKGSVGYGQDLKDIAAAYGLTEQQLRDSFGTRKGGAQLGLDRATNDIGQQRNSINNDLANQYIDYKGNISGLNEQIRGNQFQQDNRYRDYRQQYANYNDQWMQNQYEYNYQQGQRDITSQTIDSVAREYGIREGDVNNALNQAMSRAGLDYNNTINQLNQMLQSNNAQTQTQAQNFLASLLAQA
jgi:hypothetical protein